MFPLSERERPFRNGGGEALLPPCHSAEALSRACGRILRVAADRRAQAALLRGPSERSGQEALVQFPRETQSAGLVATGGAVGGLNTCNPAGVARLNQGLFQCGDKENLQRPAVIEGSPKNRPQGTNTILGPSLAIMRMGKRRYLAGSGDIIRNIGECPGCIAAVRGNG